MRVVIPVVLAVSALFVAVVGGGGEPEKAALAASSVGDVETRRAVLADVDLGPLKTVGPGEAAAGRSELVLAMAEPDSFRPDERSLADQSAVVVADLLYDGLTEVDGHTGALVPALARSWTSDASFRNWTFQLDPGAGVTAADVVAALTPLACDPNAPAGATQSAPALTAGISSVTAIEEDVVAIDLVHPNAGLAWILSGLPYSVIGIDGSQTGDYEVSRTDDGGLWLERRSVRPGHPGTPQSVQIRWTSSSATAHRLLADGVVDGAIIGPDRLDDIDGRFTVATSPSTAVRFYVLNPTADELSSRETRVDLVNRLDADALVAAAGRSDLVALDGLVSPGLVGFQPASCGSACGELDSDSAPELIPGPGVAWSVERPLEVTYVGDGQASVAQALVAQLDDAGIPAQLAEASARELASAIVEGAPALFAFGWVAPAGSVDAVVPPLLRLDSPANVARFSSAGLEELLDEAATTADDEARWALLERAHQLALTEARVLPVAVSTGTMVWAPDVSGAVQRPDGSIDLETLP